MASASSDTASRLRNLRRALLSVALINLFTKRVATISGITFTLNDGFSHRISCRLSDSFRYGALVREGLRLPSVDSLGAPAVGAA